MTNTIPAIDREALAFLSKNYLYLDDEGKCRSWRPLPQSAYETYKRDQEKLEELLWFLARGESAGGIFAMKWLRNLVTMPKGDGNTTGMSIAEEEPEFIVDWASHEVRPIDGNREMHYLSGPKGTGVSVLYADDKSRDVDRTKYIPVIRYWVVDWTNQTLAFIEAPDGDAFRIWSELFPLLHEFGSLPATMKWVRAREAFVAGRPAAPGAEEPKAASSILKKKEEPTGPCLCCTHCGKRITGPNTKVWVVRRMEPSRHPTYAPACSEACADAAKANDASALAGALQDIENQGVQVVSVTEYFSVHPKKS